jgi:hypothetical protein
MNRIPMSTAAAALLRVLIARSGAPRDRILLSDAQSIDWRSLTFTGERHSIELRSPGRIRGWSLNGCVRASKMPSSASRG